MFWLFRGQAEGVSSSRERGAEDSYPSQRDETTVWDCKTDYWFKLFVLGNQAIQGYKKLYFLSFFLLKKLEATDFDEKKEINKRKQMILEGKVSIYLKWTDNSHFNA